MCVCVRGFGGGGFLPKYLHWKNPFKMIISYKTSMFLYIKPSIVNMLNNSCWECSLTASVSVQYELSCSVNVLLTISIHVYLTFPIFSDYICFLEKIFTHYNMYI